MSKSLFGTLSDTLLDTPEQRLRDAAPLPGAVHLGNYYIQPVYGGERELRDDFEVIDTGNKVYVYDVLGPGPLAMRMAKAYLQHPTKTCSVAPSVLIAGSNPTRIILEYLESGAIGVFLRCAYGAYHETELYYVNSVKTGQIQVVQSEHYKVQGYLGDDIVEIEIDQPDYPAGTFLNVAWIPAGGEGFPYTFVTSVGASSPR